MSNDVLEIAMLHIKPGQIPAFLENFQEAAPLISTQNGYIRHELRPCIEDDHKFVLLVWWNTLEDHTIGFRHSADYQKWRELLHHFYEPFPIVEHFS